LALAAKLTPLSLAAENIDLVEDTALNQAEMREDNLNSSCIALPLNFLLTKLSKPTSA